jgi:hypothetical protein
MSDDAKVEPEVMSRPIPVQPAMAGDCDCIVLLLAEADGFEREIDEAGSEAAAVLFIMQTNHLRSLVTRLRQRRQFVDAIKATE